MAAPYSQFSPSPTPVNVCVEAVLESQIQEVRVVEKPDAPDGHEIQEVYVPYVDFTVSQNTFCSYNITYFREKNCIDF